MACNCGKNRKRPVTGYAVPTATPEPKHQPTPHILIRENGSTQEFPSRIAAYAAQITEGGGTITPVSQTS